MKQKISPFLEMKKKLRSSELKELKFNPTPLEANNH